MAVLERDQLTAIRQRNERELGLGSKSTHGYPKDTIHDLLQTIDYLTKEKKKWQRIAEYRGAKFRKIVDICLSATPAPVSED